MAWSDEEIGAVRAQIARMSTSPVLRSAGRMAALLAYLVEAELEGAANQLNQSRIAIDVFGRGANFDASTDSIVRVEIGRLRSKLVEYYATEGKDDEVFIDLPKGRYKPTLSFRRAAAPDAGDFNQEIKYCRAKDGVAIAYAESGAGPTIIKAGNWLSHLEFDVQSPVWRHWWAGLSERHRLVRYDMRDCGLSDRDVEDISFERWVDDLECVADQAAPGKFALLGISQGTAQAIAYAVRHPHRVSHLILYGGFARGRLHRGDAENAETHALFMEIIRVGWGRPHGAFRQAIGAHFMPEGTSEQFRWFDELARVSMSSVGAARTLDASARSSVEDLLPKVRVPTIVLHSVDEILVPFSEARLLASRICGAQLVSLDSRNHLILGNEAAWLRFLAQVEQFIAEN